MSVPYFCVPLGTPLRRPEATDNVESTAAAANEDRDEMKHSADQPRILPRASDDDTSLRREATDNAPNEANARQNGPLEDVGPTPSCQWELVKAKRKVQQLQHELALFKRQAQEEREQQDEANANQVMEHERVKERLNQMQESLKQAKQRENQQVEASASQRRELEDAQQRADRLEQELEKAALRAQQQRQDAEQAAQRVLQLQQKLDQQEEASARQRKKFQDTQRRVDQLQELDKDKQRAIKMVQKEHKDAKQQSLQLLRNYNASVKVSKLLIRELNARVKDVGAIAEHAVDTSGDAIDDACARGSLCDSITKRHVEILSGFPTFTWCDRSAPHTTFDDQAKRYGVRVLRDNLESTGKEWIEALQVLSTVTQKEKSGLVSSETSDSNGSSGVEDSSPSAGSDPSAASDSDRLIETDDDAVLDSQQSQQNQPDNLSHDDEEEEWQEELKHDGPMSIPQVCLEHGDIAVLRDHLSVMEKTVGVYGRELECRKSDIESLMGGFNDVQVMELTEERQKRRKEALEQFTADEQSMPQHHIEHLDSCWELWHQQIWKLSEAIPDRMDGPKSGADCAENKLSVWLQENANNKHRDQENEKDEAPTEKPTTKKRSASCFSLSGLLSW